MTLSYRLAESGDAPLFDRVAPGVFDREIDLGLLAEFLRDPRHHIALASDDGVIVGFVSAVDYVHPDKPRQLWINEVGVAPTHRGGGIGKRLIQLIVERGRMLGCTEAWVLTDAGNEPANALYRSAGAEKGAAQILYTVPLS
ncbi:MAG: GNAT family N-acetyltransferase [Sphingomicrobium sp.]